MQTKLLHIIFLINAVWLMSSCSSHDPAEEDLGTGKEVTFVVSEQSRASVTKDINYAGSQFAIFGDMQFKQNPKTVIFDNTAVTYSNDKWVYTDTQYWFPEHVHSFVALYPVDAPGLSDKQYSDSRLSFNYTLPDNYKDATDLAIATHRRKIDTDGKSSPIKLTFSHIMSRVNFNLTNAGAADKVIVNEIKLEGVNKTGSFTIIPAPLSEVSAVTDDYEYSWSGISNPGTITATNLNIEVPEDDVRELFPEENALFIIPQPDNKGIIMHITYTRIEDGNDEGQISLTAETPIGGWEPGKVYTYSMAVSEITKEIYLTVSVKSWQTANMPGVKVPEY